LGTRDLLRKRLQVKATRGLGSRTGKKEKNMGVISGDTFSLMPGELWSLHALAPGIGVGAFGAMSDSGH
jgi:hypothetical protein